MHQIEALMGLMNDQSNVLSPQNADLDCWETPDAWMVEATVPGFKRDEMDIQLRGRTLRIVAKHDQKKRDQKQLGNEHEGEEKEHEGKEHEQKHEVVDKYRSEKHAARRFDCSIRIPDDIAEGKISAMLVNGILDVTLPKVAPDAPKQKIEIESK